ncbi:hypothetical protein Cni_G28859 [Canna indica]|uniref:EF-hand domain-containing protein n=1 Tax=Canna indica TaxID=4628 RepID=A0AAQ3LAJ0_9LILI|nr:hypothetical protein Cni_G28859 [Canna indica]
MAPQPSQQSRASLSDDFEVLGYVNSMVEAFRAFDSNGDGLITCDELQGIMASLGYNPSAQEAQAMMRRGDTDRDGLLSLEEFLDMNTLELELGDDLALLLEAAAVTLGAAAQGGGEVTAEDLYRAVSGSLGNDGASMEDCLAIVSSLDVDGDGAVSVEDIKIIAQALLG